MPRSGTWVETAVGDGARGFEIAKVVVAELGSVGYLVRTLPGGSGQFLLPMQDVDRTVTDSATGLRPLDTRSESAASGGDDGVRDLPVARWSSGTREGDGEPPHE